MNAPWRLSLIPLGASLLGLAGCGGSTVLADASVVDAPTDVSRDAGAPCGTTVPADGAPCAREGLVCEYGTDPRRNCRTTATCTAGRFSLAVAGCPPPATDVCPATREMAAGQGCGVRDAYCTYGELACHCTDCPRNAPICGPMSVLRWDCDVPSTLPNCPIAMPPQGAPCGPEGTVCRYSCGPSNGRTCMGGVWVLSAGTECPISTRRAKREIRYVDGDAREALAAQAYATRLATYAYTDPAMGAGRHLGFIIEDQPDHSPAVAESRAQVDLYGYTSMVLAAVQSQEARIAAQQRRIEALERALARARAR